jgi:hypothetical protein
MKKFPVVEKLWPVLSMHLVLNSVLQSVPHLMTSENWKLGNLHNENIIFVIKRASQTN